MRINTQLKLDKLAVLIDTDNTITTMVKSLYEKNQATEVLYIKSKN